MKTDIYGSVLKRRIITFIKYFIMICAVIIVILPLYVVLLGSFKVNHDFIKSNAFALPKTFYMNNYLKALFDKKMLLGLINTSIIIVFSCIGTVITSSTTAFVLQRFKSSLNYYIKAFFAMATLLPSISMQVSVFQTVNSMRLRDSILAPIILYIGADIISICIFIQYLNNIPISIDECAFIDGASYPKIFSQIIFPQLKPAVNLIVIIKAVFIYNDFYTPQLYLPSENHTVISTSLYRMIRPYGTDWGVIYAGIVLCIIPTTITFFVLKRYIYGGIVSASLKEML